MWIVMENELICRKLAHAIYPQSQLFLSLATALDEENIELATELLYTITHQDLPTEKDLEKSYQKGWINGYNKRIEELEGEFIE